MSPTADGMRPRLIATAAAVSIAALVTSAAAAGMRAAASTDAAARCLTRELVVWLDTRPNHAAGSAYYTLEFTNLSPRTCTLRGYPGVSAVALNGHRLGTPASRNNAHPSRVVTLASGTSATAVLQIANADNFPRALCRPTTAAALRVYPPGAPAAKLIPFPFLACMRTGTVFLHVEAVQRA
jgi:hypothetical protein